MKTLPLPSELRLPSRVQRDHSITLCLGATFPPSLLPPTHLPPPRTLPSNAPPAAPTDPASSTLLPPRPTYTYFNAMTSLCPPLLAFFTTARPPRPSQPRCLRLQMPKKNSTPVDMSDVELPKHFTIGDDDGKVSFDATLHPWPCPCPLADAPIPPLLLLLPLTEKSPH